jgi:predicted ATPase
MDALQLRNLRSFQDTGFVNLAPLTLLLGRNSSGKSTFLRTFPLLRQSVEKRTTGPILWYGDYVDFGSFDTSLRTESSERCISLGFQFFLSPAIAPSPRLYRWLGPEFRNFRSVPAELHLELTDDGQQTSTRTRAVRLDVEGQQIRISFARNGAVESFFVNALNVLSTGAVFHVLPSGNVVPNVAERRASSEEYDQSFFAGMRASGKIAAALCEALGALFHGNTKRDTLRLMMLRLGIGSDEQVLKDLRGLKIGGKQGHRRIAGLEVSSPEFQRVRDLNIASFVPAILEMADAYLTEFASQVSYITPLRATAERYYRIQNLAVDEVDPSGKNLAMFLHSLGDGDKKDFQSWLERHFQLYVTTVMASGHISLHVTDSDSGKRYNLADVGFGLSQILPVIAQLWALARRRERRAPRRRVPSVFAVEQPELHLHPSLQARVADLLLDSIAAARANDIDVRIVVETHSETIINRIGHRVRQDGADPKDVQVIIFDRDEGQPTHVATSKYDEAGFLTDWPFGFFEPEAVG